MLLSNDINNNNNKLNKYSECNDCVNIAIEILKKIVFPEGEPGSIKEYENCKQNMLFCELFRKRSESYMKMEMFQEAKNDYEILKIMKPNDESKYITNIIHYFFLNI